MKILKSRSLRLTAYVGSLASLLLVGVVSQVQAFDAASKSSVNTDNGGLAIRGYDPVAYFTEGKPTAGVAEFKASHEGATYQFATAANRDLFVKEPAKYTPQYGGFCAFAASVGKKFDADPNVWKLVDGKLYLNVNPDVAVKWSADMPGMIGKANTN
jgi:YHS domain-containing protein